MSSSSVADLIFGGEPCLDSQPAPAPAEPEQPSVAGNACTWRAPMVRLVTGEEVPSDGVAWQSECEARAVWSMDEDKRREFLAAIERRRSPDAVLSLKNRLHDLEPYFVLEMPTRAQRRAYAERVQLQRGAHAREYLEVRVKAIWEARRVVAEPAQQSA